MQLCSCRARLLAAETREFLNRPAFAAGNDGTLYNGGGAIVAGTPTISTIVRGDSVRTFSLNAIPASGWVRQAT